MLPHRVYLANLLLRHRRLDRRGTIVFSYILRENMFALYGDMQVSMQVRTCHSNGLAVAGVYLTGILQTGGK